MKNKKQTKAGFTLIEVLVAFIIFGLAAGAVMGMLGSSSLKVAQAENERRAALAARSVLALGGNAISLGTGAQTGIMQDKISWRVDARRYDANDKNDDSSSVTELYLVNVHTVLGLPSNAAEANVTSLRLKPMAQK